MTTLDGDRLPNPHPGEILQEDFLTPMRINRSELARAIGVAPRRINEIVLGKRAVTAETDLLLTRYFGLSEGLFLKLQATWDLEDALHAEGPITACRATCDRSPKCGSSRDRRSADDRCTPPWRPRSTRR